MISVIEIPVPIPPKEEPPTPISAKVSTTKAGQIAKPRKNVREMGTVLQVRKINTKTAKTIPRYRIVRMEP